MTRKVCAELLTRDRETCKQLVNDRNTNEYNKFLKDNYRYLAGDSDVSTLVDSHIKKGIVGYDEMIVFSPKGAAWMLLNAMEMEELDPHYEGDGTWWDSTVCRRSCFDAWIARDLYGPIEEAVAGGKGLYCPKEIGYRYIHDWLPMGSDVEWGDLSVEWIQKYRTRSTDVVFEDVA